MAATPRSSLMPDITASVIAEDAFHFIRGGLYEHPVDDLKSPSILSISVQNTDRYEKG